MSTSDSTSNMQHVDADANTGPAATTTEIENPVRRRSSRPHKPKVRDDELRPLTSGTTSGTNDRRGMRSRESTVEPSVAVISNDVVTVSAFETAMDEGSVTEHPVTSTATAPLLPTVPEEEHAAAAGTLDNIAGEGENETNAAEAADVVMRNPRDIVPDPAVPGEFYISGRYNVTHSVLDGCDDGPMVPDAFELLLDIRATYPRHIPDHLKPGAPAANLGVQVLQTQDPTVVAEEPVAPVTLSDELEDLPMDQSSDRVTDAVDGWTTGGPFNSASGEHVVAHIAPQNATAQMHTGNSQLFSFGRD